MEVRLSVGWFFRSFNPMACILAQLPRCAYTITSHKPYIASLESWMIGLWMVGLRTVGSFDCNLILMDDHPAESCGVSHTAFLL